MKNLIKTLFIISILLQNVTFAKDSFVTKNEKWVGLGFQENTQNSWKIELFKISNNSYKINYPSIPCSGLWKTEKIEKNRIVFTEIINENVNKCVPINKVVVTKIDDKHLSVSYFMVDENTSHIYAFGVLELVK